MRKNSLFVLFVLLSVVQSYSQTDINKDLTINDVVLGIYTKFYPENLYNLQWQNDHYYTYNKYYFLVQKNTGNQKEKVLLSVDKLNDKLKEMGHNMLLHFPEIKWKNAFVFWFVHDNTLYNYNIEQHEFVSIIKFDNNNLDNEISPDFEKVAFVVDSNVFIQKGNVSKAITNDTVDGMVNGLLVHRKEFGIKKGLYWSPMGNKLAFYHKNESMVSNYPLINIETSIAKIQNTKYPMAGAFSEKVKIGIYNDKTEAVIYLQTIGEDYVTNITWSPNEKYIFVAELNRDQNYMRFNKFDAGSGKYIKTLFEEKHKKYVEPQNPALFLNNDASQFVWQSQRDGYNHLYLYDTSGVLKNQLTKGDWVVTEVIGVDPGNEYIYYISTQESPLERHLYKVALATKKITKITNDEGVHTPLWNHSYTRCIDNFDNQKIPRKIVVTDNNGNELEELLLAENPMKNNNLGKSIISTLRAADGITELYYKMVFPHDFSHRKKYPVIVYVYGGPHNQLVLNEWPKRIEMWMHYMAQHGYIGFMLDNRGSEARGLEFENATFGKLGYEERADQIKGIELLSGLKYVDTSRIGVFGWSYGGHMATSLMLHYPDIFKVGVAGGPVIDWQLYEVMYTERYMDTPEINPDGYDKTNLLNYVQNLDGNLLLIHGGLDPTVVIQHSLLFVRKCITLNKPIDFFVYPSHEHNVTGKDRIHLMDKVSNYFFDNL